MGKFGSFSLIVCLACCAQASWYWPFGSSEEEEKEQPRVSELMEPASLLIDDAADLAADGKVGEAVAKYKEALAELDRIEAENPERAAGVEFATLRNKRAYVNAAIDTMQLSEIQSNAKTVAVSDTTELERRLAEEKAEKVGKGKKKTKQAEPAKDEPVVASQRETPARPAAPARPLTKREQAMQAVATGDFALAERLIGELLTEKPNSPVALNLKAAMEARQGKLKEAEETLDQALVSNPRNPFTFYNMARLMLQTRPDNKAVAKRYYESGRSYGGAPDAQLEAAFR